MNGGKEEEKQAVQSEDTTLELPMSMVLTRQELVVQLAASLRKNALSLCCSKSARSWSVYGISDLHTDGADIRNNNMRLVESWSGAASHGHQCALLVAGDVAVNADRFRVTLRCVAWFACNY
jgi:hypothetical protein